MPIINIILFTICFFLFCSCNSFKSKIELRNGNCGSELPDSKLTYLVNTSKSKSVRVTVRQVEASSDSTKDYQIKFYTLSPGDEKNLGCSEKIYPIQYEKKKEIIIGTYEEFEKNSDESVRLAAALKLMEDTIVSGQRKQYYQDEVDDYDKPIKRIITKLSYEITGEVVVVVNK